MSLPSAEVIRRKEEVGTHALRNHHRGHGRIESCFADSQVGGARLGVFPRHAGVRVVLLGKVDQFGQSISFAWIRSEGAEQIAAGAVACMVGCQGWLGEAGALWAEAICPRAARRAW